MSATSGHDNPLRAGLEERRAPEPCAIVIFGASGDLTHRKLLPALCALARGDHLPDHFVIIGVARRDWDDAAFRAAVRGAIQPAGESGAGSVGEARSLEDFIERLYYQKVDYGDEDGYRRLGQRLEEIDSERKTRGNRIFYLSVPPSIYPTIIDTLGRSGLATGGSGWSRIVVEKPFGRDLRSAEDLDSTLRGVFSEDQIFRIDHYLGKETVQNLLVFRFANAIFEPIWNHHYIDQVQISVAETLGVGDRGGYYEEAGVVRDMFQNHLLQLLSLTAMEPPLDFDPDSVRDEKLKVLRAIRPFRAEDVSAGAVRGQYSPGWMAGERVPAYREEKGVTSGSVRETYAAIRFFVDNWRWSGVPFYLRSGKRLPRKASEIYVRFGAVPHRLFEGAGGEGLTPNSLAIRIQPNEGMALRFEVKMPGPRVQLRSVKMDFQYGAGLGVVQPADAYEQLLLDVVRGDSTLFIRGDEVRASWTIVDPIIEHWERVPPEDFPNYEAGSWGPDAANELIARRGRQRWHRL